MSNKKLIVIAEAGVNHNGEVELAKKLIDVAADAGADYIKFQTFKTEKLVDITARKADYQTANTHCKDNSQFNMLKKLELDIGAYPALIEHCNKQNINFLSTPFDLDSIDLLLGLGMETFKIPSGEITNLPYLKKIGSLKKQVILSTGMSSMEEIAAALNVLASSGTPKENITVLHCNTEYPTPMEDVNLMALLSIEKEFDVNVGYSDHTLGIEVPIAATALGATVIEKHFTLDRNMEGPDHKASLDPVELKAMVKAIRNIEKAMGDGVKKPTKSELKNKEIVRKSIFIAHDLPEGHIIEENDLEMKRPGDGISPMEMGEITEKKLLVSKKKGEKLLPSDFSSKWRKK